MSSALPQLTTDYYLTDGGLETTLVFQRGVDLPEFAAFPLLDSPTGRRLLSEYFEPYFDLAERTGRGFIIDTPTWRANPDWATGLGYDTDALAEINRRAVAFVVELAAARPGLDVVVDGVIGPRGDGYVVDDTMTADEAMNYHFLQAKAFAEAGAEMITAVTMTYAEEAIGVVRAAVSSGLPVVVSFTVETDGTLPSGQRLQDAIARVDEATDGAAAYFMINCAHPTHFDHLVADGAPWLGRIKGIRANASALSHAELDAAEELDRGDPEELAGHYRNLADRLPELRVVGGCCGTDHQHVALMAAALA